MADEKTSLFSSASKTDENRSRIFIGPGPTKLLLLFSSAEVADKNSTSNFVGLGGRRKYRDLLKKAATFDSSYETQSLSRIMKYINVQSPNTSNKYS
jgi:hypothetical protein